MSLTGKVRSEVAKDSLSMWDKIKRGWGKLSFNKKVVLGTLLGVGIGISFLDPGIVIAWGSLVNIMALVLMQ